MELDPNKRLEAVMQGNGGNPAHSKDELNKDLMLMQPLVDHINLCLSGMEECDTSTVRGCLDYTSNVLSIEPAIGGLLRYLLKYGLPFGPPTMVSTEIAAKTGLAAYSAMLKAKEMHEEADRE